MDRERLKRDVERIEKHREEKAAVAKSEREIFAALKSDGFNCKVVREILKRRGMDDSDGWDAEVATYEAAVKGLREAAEAVRSGATYEEAATAHHVRKADLHHFVQATDAVPETHNPEHEAAVAESGPPSHGGTPDSKPTGEGIGQQETRDLVQPQVPVPILPALSLPPATAAAFEPPKPPIITETNDGESRDADSGASGADRGGGAGAGDTTYQQHLDDFRRTPDHVYEAAERARLVVRPSSAEPPPNPIPDIDLTLPPRLDRRGEVAPALKSAPPPRGGNTRDELVQ